jgi:hypothetical protein
VGDVGGVGDGRGVAGGFLELGGHSRRAFMHIVHIGRCVFGTEMTPGRHSRGHRVHRGYRGEETHRHSRGNRGALRCAWG